MQQQSLGILFSGGSNGLGIKVAGSTESQSGILVARVDFVTNDHNSTELRATITQIKTGKEATFVDLQWPRLARILDFDLASLGNAILSEPSHQARRGWVLIRGSVNLRVGDTIGAAQSVSNNPASGTGGESPAP